MGRLGAAAAEQGVLAAAHETGRRYGLAESADVDQGVPGLVERYDRRADGQGRRQLTVGARRDLHAAAIEHRERRAQRVAGDLPLALRVVAIDDGGQQLAGVRQRQPGAVWREGPADDPARAAPQIAFARVVTFRVELRHESRPSGWPASGAPSRPTGRCRTLTTTTSGRAEGPRLADARPDAHLAALLDFLTGALEAPDTHELTSATSRTTATPRP